MRQATLAFHRPQVADEEHHHQHAQHDTTSDQAAPASIALAPPDISAPTMATIQASTPTCTSARVTDTLHTAASSDPIQAPPSPSAAVTDPAMALHPLFRPKPPRSAQAGDSPALRPVRSARSKAPQSYREDLNAVLRADAAVEAKLLRDTQSDSETPPKKRRGRPPKQPSSSPGTPPPTSQPLPIPASKPATRDSDDFEVLSATKAPAQPRPQAPPLSLVARGTIPANGNSQTKAHPFFAKREPKPKPDPKPELKPERGEEISAEASSAPAERSTPSWSLFNQKNRSGHEPKKAKVPVEAPWPSPDVSHVFGWTVDDLNVLARAGALLTHRAETQHNSTKGKARAHDSDTDATLPPEASKLIKALLCLRHPGPPPKPLVLKPSARSQSQPVNLSACPRTNGELPSAVQRLLYAAPMEPTQRAWTEYWRPLRANECLGNEDRAAFLLKWLRELQVQPANVTQPTKRRKQGIQRKIDKRKRARGRRRDDSDEDEMADFIVNDSEEEEAWFDQFRPQSSQDLSQSSSSTRAFHIAESPVDSPALTPTAVPSANFSKLTNCILLSGPTGCGKTAAVYACAAELGFEVFELFPGMGKRSGKELSSAVGDLGRNHMVSSGGTGGGATWKRDQPQQELQQQERGEGQTVRQSLILVEEADVLFEEDKGFWAAVVELIGESRRPVVITCNDPSMVPTADLPLQEILYFEQPGWDLAVPYLQLMAKAGGYNVERSDVESMLDSLAVKYPLDVGARYPPPDGAVHPDALEDLVAARTCVDLRKAINQLHVGLLYNGPAKETKSSDSGDLRCLAREAEMRSHSDAVVERKLVDPFSYGQPGVEMQAEMQLASHMRQLVAQPGDRPCLIGGGDGGACETQLRFDLDRRTHAQHVETMLALVQSDVSSRVPRPAAMLEYAPYVRLMNEFDEAEQDQQQAQAALSTSSRNGRSTRNSNGFFLRWLPFGPEEIRAARCTAFPCDLSV